MVNCCICNRELTNEVSVIRGIGPICRSQVLEKTRFYKSKVCDYRLEFIDDHKIVIIHERYDPDHPKISLTNCIEFVVNEIVDAYNLCVNSWAFIEHANNQGTLFGEYHEYDLVDVAGESLKWRYLHHSDAKGETKKFSRELIIERVNKYRAGAKTVID